MGWPQLVGEEHVNAIGMPSADNRSGSQDSSEPIYAMHELKYDGVGVSCSKKTKAFDVYQ